MKLLVATPLYPPEIGGPATYAKLLEEGLQKKGVDVKLIKFSDVRHLPRFIRHFVYYRRVLRAAHDADIILALDPVSVGFPAMWAARKLGKKFVVKIVGDYAWEQGQQRFGITTTLDEFVKTQKVPLSVRILRQVQTRVAHSATRVIVPSEYLKNIITTWGIAPEKIEVIYNAVSLADTGSVPGAVAKLPRPLVVSVGRLVPWKHVDRVIDAVEGVFGSSLAIVGDGPEYKDLERLASEKLTGRAVLTGLLTHQDTLAVMKSADVLVLNSSYEGMSHLLIEALMLGIPIIATSVGGNPEVITDDTNGLLISPKEPHALANALARVLGEPELQARLRAGALISAKRFSVDAMLARTSDVLTL